MKTPILKTREPALSCNSVFAAVAKTQNTSRGVWCRDAACFIFCLSLSAVVSMPRTTDLTVPLVTRAPGCRVFRIERLRKTHEKTYTCVLMLSLISGKDGGVVVV